VMVLSLRVTGEGRCVLVGASCWWLLDIRSLRRGFFMESLSSPDT